MLQNVMTYAVDWNCDESKRVNRYVLANMNAVNTMRFILILLVVKIIHLWGNALTCDESA